VSVETKNRRVFGNCSDENENISKEFYLLG
jgi:hypothetical protein